jgi:capsular polysaccharide transport system ATP-binding protein
MIVLHSVSKVVGHGSLRKMVLDQVNWTIPRRSRTLIFGQKGAGKTMLVSMINGTIAPTSGWVERRASISFGGSKGLGGNHLTVRQFISRYAYLYRADPNEIVEFVARFADVEHLIDLKLGVIPRQIASRVYWSLLLAIPFDFYLVENMFGDRKGEFGERCRAAFELRTKDAGLIQTTASAKHVTQFEGNAGVLHGGKLTLFDSVREAAEVYSALPPPVPETFRIRPDSVVDEEEEEWA